MEPRLTELNDNEILMYLGHRGQKVPEDLVRQIEICKERVMKAARPRFVWRRVSYRDHRAEDLLLPGKDIENLMEQCGEAVLVAATLGPEIDQITRKYEVVDAADALIMDACASVAIENVCNHFEEDLREEITGEGKFLTDRFSPGYGDLPLEIQKDLCRMLNASRRIGLTVSESMLMVPCKSVTAVIGIADQPQPHRASGCEVCNLFRTCEFRKEGRSCHG